MIDLTNAQYNILMDLYPDKMEDAIKYAIDVDGYRVYDSNDNLLAIISSIYWKHIMPQ